MLVEILQHKSFPVAQKPAPLIWFAITSHYQLIRLRSAFKVILYIHGNWSQALMTFTFTKHWLHNQGQCFVNINSCQCSYIENTTLRWTDQELHRVMQSSRTILKVSREIIWGRNVNNLMLMSLLFLCSFNWDSAQEVRWRTYSWRVVIRLGHY